MNERLIYYDAKPDTEIESRKVTKTITIWRCPDHFRVRVEWDKLYKETQVETLEKTFVYIAQTKPDKELFD